jgi:hypothetical protein
MTASARLLIFVVDDDVSAGDTSSLVLRHAGSKLPPSMILFSPRKTKSATTVSEQWV